MRTAFRALAALLQCLVGAVTHHDMVTQWDALLALSLLLQVEPQLAGTGALWRLLKLLAEDWLLRRSLPCITCACHAKPSPAVTGAALRE